MIQIFGRTLYSWHKAVPFEGSLTPETQIGDPNATLLFGSYTLWRYAERHGLSPGVDRIRPFLFEQPWHPYMLNGTDAQVLRLSELPETLHDDGPDWFKRPVADSKEFA